MQKEQKMQIGVVIKPKGLDGTLKCKIVKNDFDELLNIKKIFVGAQSYSIVKAYKYDGFVFVKLNQVDTIEHAEELRGKKIYIDRDDAAKLKKDEIYIADLISATVVLGDELLGKIERVENFGASEIIFVSTKSGEIMVPLVKGLIISLKDRIVEFDKKVYLQVAGPAVE